MKQLPQSIERVRERSDAAYDYFGEAWDTLQRVPDDDVEGQVRATDAWVEARCTAHAAQDEFERLLRQVVHWQSM